MAKLEIFLADGTSTVISRPMVDPKRCIGCGVYEARCPTRVRPAIRVRAPVD
jgi:ferredoxin